VRFGVRFLVAALFLHDEEICAFIPVSGADKGHKCQSSTREGEQKTERFLRIRSVFFFLISTPFSLCRIL
jgi:hypothetical protein